METLLNDDFIYRPLNLIERNTCCTSHVHVRLRKQTYVRAYVRTRYFKHVERMEYEQDLYRDWRLYLHT